MLDTDKIRMMTQAIKKNIESPIKKCILYAFVFIIVLSFLQKFFIFLHCAWIFVCMQSMCANSITHVNMCFFRNSSIVFFFVIVSHFYDPALSAPDQFLSDSKHFFFYLSIYHAILFTLAVVFHLEKGRKLDALYNILECFTHFN